MTTYLQGRRYDQALKALATLERKQPVNPLTYNLKGAIYSGKSDSASARKYFEQALELQPTYLPAAQNLAQLFIAEGKPQKARKLLEDIANADRNNADTLLALAELAPRIGASGKEQQEWLERARVADPHTARPAIVLARFYVESGQAAKALDVLSVAQANNRDNAELLDALAGVLLAAGEKQRAVDTYAKVATLLPKSAQARFRLANAQSLNSDARGATVSLRRALDLNPGYTEAQAALVGLETRAGRFVEAAALARQIQSGAAKSPLGFVLEGDVLMAEKKYLPAAKVYDVAYGLHPSGVIAIKLSVAYSEAGKPEEADKRMANWLSASPDDAVARRYLADVALQAGRYGKAIEQYEWLRQKQPDNIGVLNNLANAYLLAKDGRALSTAERAYQLDPRSPEVADTLGWILVAQGDPVRGVDLLQRAVVPHPTICRCAITGRMGDSRRVTPPAPAPTSNSSCRSARSFPSETTP